MGLLDRLDCYAERIQPHLDRAYDEIEQETTDGTRDAGAPHRNTAEMLRRARRYDRQEREHS